MRTYHADTLQPGRLVCDTCGRKVATVPVGLKHPRGVTREQIERRFPDLADRLRSHDTLCNWRRNPWPCSTSPEDIRALARGECACVYRKRHPGCTELALDFHVEMHWREYREYARFLASFIERLFARTAGNEDEDEDEDEDDPADAA
jgi:hypothetical protein